MIVYNVAREWFTMQADCDKRRKALGLKPADMGKVVVNNREELCAVLNALCGMGTIEAQEAKTILAGNGLIAPAIVARASIAFDPNDPAAPLFLRVDLAKRRGLPIPEE